MEKKVTRTGERASGEPRQSARFASVLICLICCVGMLCFATGCRNSDALKEIIFDQDSEIVDYDNEEKFYINNPESEEESDEVSSDEAAAANKVTERVQNIVVYSSKPNSAEYEAKKSVWSEDPDFTGIEASETVSFIVSEDENVKSTIPSLDQDEEDDDEEQDSQAPVSSTTGTTGTTGSEGTGESDEKGGLDSEDASEVKAQSGEGGGETADSEEDDDAVEIVDTTNDFEDPPLVDTIAATGQTAVIVQMVGGEGALAAADKEILTDEEFQTVFEDEGAADIVQGWSGEGEAGDIDVDAIIDSGAETILVTSSEYSDELTKAERKKLKKAGVSFTIVSELTNSTFIKSTVTTVGKMLKESEAIGNAGETTKIASDYKEFHNDLIDECIDSNDGLVAYDSKILEKRNNKKYTYNDGGSWTLLIDAWDSSVDWKDDSLSMNGIALSNIGYSTTPVSFYIQAGGLINCAAAKAGSSQSGLYADWQFGQGYRGYKSNFTYDEGGLFDESITSQSKNNRNRIASTVWGDVFFSMPNDAEVAISNSISGIAPDAFGSDNFPKVIAATQQIKTKLIANSEKENGAYHPYDYQENGALGSYFGPADDYSAWASIGSPGQNGDNCFLDDGSVIPDDAVCVNPHGLFSSWTEGGSVESVLEAAWVNDVVNEDADDTIGWKSKVREFYETFYRYSLSDSELDAIVDGLEK